MNSIKTKLLSLIFISSFVFAMGALVMAFLAQKYENRSSTKDFAKIVGALEPTSSFKHEKLCPSTNEHNFMGSQ